MGASPGVIVRPEAPGDAPGIREVHELAFGGPAEADLVDALREHRAVTLSLLAVRGDGIVGHILFSPAEILAEGSRLAVVALGPMAVRPEHQRTGVGSRLVEVGLAILRRDGHGLVLVLGHPEYYPRFGFVPASRLGIRCPFDAPDAAFMARELEPFAWTGGSGVVRYRREFGAA